jgi:hypothetical protein
MIMVAIPVLAAHSLYAGDPAPPHPIFLNRSYFEGVVLTTSTQMVTLRIPSPSFPAYRAIGETATNECVAIAHQQSPAGCRVQVAKVETDLYSFLLLEQRGEWIHVLADPKSMTTKWILPARPPFADVFIEPITHWILSSRMVPAKGLNYSDITIADDPQETSPSHHQCSDIENPTEVKGSWVRITCTFSISPSSQYTRVWARWLSEDGHLMLYPSSQRWVDDISPE